MRTLQIYDGTSDMLQALHEYFSETNASLQVFMVGNIADVSVSYEDFKPIRVVRKELEAKFANISISEIHRTFSQKTQFSILREMLDADELIYVENATGDSIRPVRIGELITERMYNRTISN